MTTTIQADIERLIANGKLKQAKEALRTLLSAPETDHDKAHARVLFAKLYMDVMNRINREELRVANAMIDTARLVDKAEGEGRRQIDISKAKADLHGAYGK